VVEKRLFPLLVVVLILSAFIASCGGNVPPAVTPATQTPPPPAPTADLNALRTEAAKGVFATLTASVPTVDLNAIRTDAALGVFATLTASAPTLIPVSTAATATATTTNPAPTSTSIPTSTRTRVPPTLTFTPAPPTPTPPRLLAANLGGGGNLIGRLLYIDTGSPEPTYTSQFYFEVTANNPKVGSSNGAGIDSVDFEISDSQGNTVYRHTESAPRYCSFSGNEPCNEFDFAADGFRWPDSDQKIQGVDLRLHNATYQVDVTVRGKNNNELSGSLTFDIRCGGCPN
jgi:hypothetical protein